MEHSCQGSADHGLQHDCLGLGFTGSEVPFPGFLALICASLTPSWQFKILGNSSPQESWGLVFKLRTLKDPKFFTTSGIKNWYIYHLKELLDVHERMVYAKKILSK